MASNDQTATFDLDATFDDDFDPLDDAGFEGDDDVDFPVGSGDNIRGGITNRATPVAEHDPRPAAERIAELFDHMGRRRRMLERITAFCAERRPVGDVSAFIEDLKSRDRCVYSPNDLTSLLARAGAIERVDASGAPYPTRELEPRTVVVDGVEYLEPQTPPPAFWQATPAGVAAAAADQPATRIQALLEDESIYLPIFRRILTVCSGAAGATAHDISKKVDADPLLAKPRYYAPRFVEKLGQVEALEWNGRAWVLTDVGRTVLAELADVVDPASDELAATIDL